METFIKIHLSVISIDASFTIILIIIIIIIIYYSTTYFIIFSFGAKIILHVHVRTVGMCAVRTPRTLQFSVRVVQPQRKATSSLFPGKTIHVCCSGTVRKIFFFSTVPVRAMRYEIDSSNPGRSPS